MQKIVSISYQRSIVEGIVCSKRSDSGERCEVKKAMKSRGGLGRECSSSLAFIFSRSFLLRTAPHYLNAWNRLWSAVHECPASPISVIELQSFEFGNRLWGGTTLYELYSYVQPHRVWFCAVLVLNRVWFSLRQCVDVFIVLILNK